MAKRPVEVEFKLIDGVSKGLASITSGISGVGASLTSVKGLAIQAAAAFGLFKIGGAFADGVAASATFEQSLDKISAKTGVTGEALQALGAEIRRVSQDASKTGDDGAAAFQRLTAEGLNAADALTQLPAALDFATASSQGAAEAVGALSDNLDAFGLGADQFSRAADVITAGALKGGTGVADLQKALQLVGPTARDLGLSLEQTTATLATLAQNGLEGGKAGKALAAVFDQLRDKNSQFSQELDKAGIKSRDFNTVIAALADGGTKTQAALNALGVNGTAAVKALGRDGGAALAALTKQLGDVEGTTNRTAATINQGLLASFTRLKEAGDAALSAFLQPILGPLADEFDALAKTINEFAASPAFEDLKTNFKSAFVDGLEALKAFIAEFDFSAATKSVQDFVKGAGENLQSFKDSTLQIAEALRAVFNTLSTLFNAVQTGVSASVLGVTRSLEVFYGALGKVSPAAKRVSEELGHIADVAEQETNLQIKQLKDSAAALAGNMKVVAGETEATTAAQQRSIPVLQAISKEALFAAEAANAMAAAQREEAAQAMVSADAQRNHATALGDVVKAGDGAVESMNGLKEASDNEIAAFRETQKEIQASIDARKKLASSYGEVGEAADDAGEQVEGFRNQMDEDLSSAIFQGLTEGFGRVKRDLALLRGVSEDVVARGLNEDLKGATNTLNGLNAAIKRGDAEIAKLGGNQALEKLRREAEAAAEAIAQIGPNAIAAAADLDAMVRSLKDAADARGGDDEAIEKRRFEEELARIAELERVSGGTNRAAADLARQLAQKEHQARLAEIAAEGRARVDSETGADATIAASRAGQSATGAPKTGGGGLSASAPSTTDNRNIDLSITVQGVIDDALLAKLSRLQKQRARDSL